MPGWAPVRRNGQAEGRTGRTHPAPRLRRASFVRQASPRARRDRQTDKLASNSLKVKVLIGEATSGGRRRVARGGKTAAPERTLSQSRATHTAGRSDPG